MRTEGADVLHAMRYAKDLEEYSLNSPLSLADVSRVVLSMDEMQIARDVVAVKPGIVHGAALVFPVLQRKGGGRGRAATAAGARPLADSICTCLARCVGTNFSFPVAFFSITGVATGPATFTMLEDSFTALLFAGIMPDMVVWDGISGNKSCENLLSPRYDDSLCGGVRHTQDATHVFKRLVARFFGSRKRLLVYKAGGRAWQQVSSAHVGELVDIDSHARYALSGTPTRPLRPRKFCSRARFCRD